MGKWSNTQFGETMKTEINFKRTINLLIILTSLAINVFLGLTFYQKYSVRPTAAQSTMTAESYLSPDAELYLKYIDLIKDYINSQNFASKTEEIDFVRSWVYKNSIHDIDSSYNLRQNSAN